MTRDALPSGCSTRDYWSPWSASRRVLLRASRTDSHRPRLLRRKKQGSRMDQAGITASPRLRVSFLVVAALMFLLWGWSLVPPIENWNNPYEDGFSYVGVFYASILIFQHIANSMGGL